MLYSRVTLLLMLMLLVVGSHGETRKCIECNRRWTASESLIEPDPGCDGSDLEKYSNVTCDVLQRRGCFYRVEYIGNGRPKVIRGCAGSIANLILPHCHPLPPWNQDPLSKDKYCACSGNNCNSEVFVNLEPTTNKSQVAMDDGSGSSEFSDSYFRIGFTLIIISSLTY